MTLALRRRNIPEHGCLRSLARAFPFPGKGVSRHPSVASALEPKSPARRPRLFAAKSPGKGSFATQASSLLSTRRQNVQPLLSISCALSSFPKNYGPLFSFSSALFFSLFCTSKKATPLFSIHCALSGKNMGGGSSFQVKTSERTPTQSGPPNTIRMNTYAKSHFNPFVMNTYKNTRLKVVQNEHLQKKGGVGGIIVAYAAAWVWGMTNETDIRSGVVAAVVDGTRFGAMTAGVWQGERREPGKKPGPRLRMNFSGCCPAMLFF